MLEREIVNTRKEDKTRPLLGLSFYLCLLLPGLVTPWEDDLCRVGVTARGIRMCVLHVSI
jgi:hypothetical protein